MYKEYEKSAKYDREFIDDNMMGPNSMMILEELMEKIELKKGARVLDLGCGNGLTSIFLAKEYEVQVFAVDLWISATSNMKRFKQFGLDEKIIPLQLDAVNMPFANDYFDAVISVDAYHYFGNNSEYFNQEISGILKQDAIVALAFPGMKFEINQNIPVEMQEFWEEEALETWHSIDWWKDKFKNSICSCEINELSCFDQAWNDWLRTENPYAIEDRGMIKADGGKYMNLISVTGNSIK